MTERLKRAVNTISVDLFGHEKTLTTNVLSFLDRSAREWNAPLDHAEARIVRQQGEIQVFLYHLDRAVRFVPLEELVYFFAVTEQTDPFMLQERILSGLNRLLNELATKHPLPAPGLHLRIKRQGMGISITVFHSQKQIQELPVKTLINYFIR